MTERLSPVDFQYLLIQVFTVMESEKIREIESECEIKDESADKNRVSGQLAAESECKSEKPNPSVKAFILACITFGNERRKNSKYCATFLDSCESILVRLGASKEKQLRKKDCIEALGWNNGVQLNRIEKGEAQMQIANIKTLCDNFDKECDRKFWRNHLLTFFPDVMYAGFDSETEYEGLCWVLKKLGKEEVSLLEKDDRKRIDFIKGKQEKSRKDSGKGCQEKSRKDSGKGCQEKSRKDSGKGCQEKNQEESASILYETIMGWIGETPSMTLEKLLLDELYTTRESWYAWKRKWEDAEKEGFKEMPKPRLRRKYLLVIAIVCEKEYLDVVRLLQLGGYRLGMTEEDREIANYFLKSKENRDEFERERLKSKLLASNY